MCCKLGLFYGTQGGAGIIGLCILGNITFKHSRRFKVHGGEIAKKTATFPKVRRCGLDQTIGVNPGINTPQRALHYTHSRTGHMEGLSNIWDRPPKRINFKNNLQIFNFSCISTIQSFSALACVLWVLVSKVDLVHSKRSGA